MLDASAALTFTAKGTNSPASASADLLGDRVAGLVLRLGGAGAEVRGDDHLRQLEERRAGGGLGGEHVDGGAADAALADGLGEGVLVDHAAARHVDDPQARLGEGEQLLADHAERLGGLHHVQGEEVGHPHELLEAEQLDVDLAGSLGGDEGVVGHDLHRRRPTPAGPPACRCGRGRRCRAPCRPAPRPPTGCAPSDPSMSAAWAWGMLRAWASSSAIVCSAVVRMFDCGAFTTITPWVVAASVSTLSSPMPARPDHHEVLPGRQHLGGDGGGRADDQGVGARAPPRGAARG